MTERLSSTYTRVEFSAAVRRAADERCKGRCEGCGRVLIKRVYDHDWPHRLGGPSTLENCKVLCADGPDSCNALKTNGMDVPGIAARKRHEKGRLPLDIDRPEHKPGKIKSAGFQKGHRPLRSGNNLKRAK